MIFAALKRLAKRVFRWRSARTGRYVTADYARDNPDTTLKERVR